MDRILLVDDDPGIRALIADFLQAQGYEVVGAADAGDMDGALARATAAGRSFDCLILDRMMPGEDGLSITRRLAATAAPPAIIILSALGEDQQRIEGLEGGADDYVAKPVNPSELLARVRAVLRRRQRADGPARLEARFGGWRLDFVRRQLSSPAGVLLALTDGEFALLCALSARPNQVLSREALVHDIQGAPRDTLDRAVDVQISRLRRKLERGAGEAGADLIRTVRHEGYMLATGAAA